MTPAETARPIACSKRIRRRRPMDLAEVLDRQMAGAVTLDTREVVNCAGGYRSLIAASVLRRAGFADVSDLLGGYGAWANAGLPISGGQTPEPVPAAEIGPQVANALVQDGAVLLDVREPDEWEAGHAPAAVFIPMSQVEGRLAELEPTAKTVVVCRSGGRSEAITHVPCSRGAVSTR